MNKHFYILALFTISFGVKAQTELDTLVFTSAEAEKISNLEQQLIELTKTLEGLQGATELLEASQDSMAASLAEGEQRAEENKDVAASALSKSRQNSDELDKIQPLALVWRCCCWPWRHLPSIVSPTRQPPTRRRAWPTTSRPPKRPWQSS